MFLGPVGVASTGGHGFESARHGPPVPSFFAQIVAPGAGMFAEQAAAFAQPLDVAAGGNVAFIEGQLFWKKVGKKVKNDKLSR